MFTHNLQCMSRIVTRFVNISSNHLKHICQFKIIDFELQLWVDIPFRFYSNVHISFVFH